LALADAGLTRQDVDGLITCPPVGTREGIDVQIGTLLRLRPMYAASLQ
jgi:hypothetical protein